MGALLHFSALCRSAAMAFAILVWGVCCAPTDVHAGLLFRLESTREFDRPAPPNFGQASGLDKIESTSFESASGSQSEEPDEELEIELLSKVSQTALHTASGGASAPTGHPGWSVSGSAATLLTAVRAQQLCPRAYHHWRERSPRLTNPAKAELLDPPKCNL